MDTIKQIFKKYLALILITIVFLLAQILSSTGIVTSYVLQVLMFCGINVMVTESLNLINGFTGQFSLGQAGFMSVGAYASAVVTKLLLPQSMLSSPVLQFAVFMLAIVVGGICAAMIGYLIGIPSLKLKGDYLAIVTMAFAEIVKVALRLIPTVGGPMGMTDIPRYSNLTIVFLFMLATLFFVRNFLYSDYGRSCIAVRDNEIAASAMGIDTTKVKIRAFVVASFIAGIGGALFAHTMMYIQPDQFNLTKSCDYQMYLYAGGIGSISGAMLGAVILTIIPEALRFLQEWRIVIYAVLLVFIIVRKPDGFFGKREFRFLTLSRSDIYAAVRRQDSHTVQGGTRHDNS